MMKIQQDYLNYLEYSPVRGSILGAAVMAAATPGINLVNSMTTRTAMPWSRPFIGCWSMAGAGAVSSATCFTMKHFLGGDEEDASDWKKFWTASVGGMISGVPVCAFECNAKTQASTLKPPIVTARIIYEHYGVAGFFRGGISMVLREGGWVAMYLAALPMLIQRFKDAGCNQFVAEGAALVISAGAFGALSAPINRARIIKQDMLDKPGTPQKSYGKIVMEMVNEFPNANLAQRTFRLYRGGMPRSGTSAVAGWLFFKGGEIYDETVKRAKGIEPKRF